MDRPLLAQIEALYDRGRYLSASRLAPPIRRLDDVPTARGKVLAGRLCARLGSEALATRFFQAAHRQAPRDPRVRYFSALLLWRRGAWHAWKHFQRHPRLAGATDAEQADWLTARATLAQALRLEQEARALVRRALALAPDDPWVWSTAAALALAFDAKDEALAHSARALAVQPHHRPAVLVQAEVFERRHDPDAARAVLAAADAATESYELGVRHASVLVELGRFEEAALVLDRAETHAPLAAARLRRAFAARRAERALRAGELAVARRWARRVGHDGYHEKLAQRLAAAPAGARRVEVPMPLVRQDWNTCLPAAHAMVLAAQGLPSLHEVMSSAVTFEGTNVFEARRWLEARGIRVRLFLVDLPSARALLDRGLPFTVTLRGPDHAHEVAAYGYDERAGVLLFRDPSFARAVQTPADTFLDGSRCHGPLGTLLIPAGLAGRQPVPALRGAAALDRLTDAWRALGDSRPDEARALLGEALADEEPALVFHALPLLAAADPAQARRRARLLAERFPDEPLAVMAALRAPDADREPGHAAALDAAARRWRHSTLALDRIQARERRGAAARERRRRFARAFRAMPAEPRLWYDWSVALWHDGAPAAEALGAARVALALNPSVEEAALQLWRMAAAAGQRRRGTALLGERHARWGRRRAAPTLSYAQALAEEGRLGAAHRLIEGVRRRHPEPAVALGVADALWAQGRAAAAAAVLDRARPARPDHRWWGRWARVQRALGCWEEAREAALRTLRLEPCPDTDTWAAFAVLTRYTRGRRAALAAVRAAAPATPPSVAHLEAALAAYRALDAHDEAAALLDRRLAAHPDDVTALADRAYEAVLARDGAAFDALEARVQALEPEAPATRALALERAVLDGRRADAARAARRLLEALPHSGFLAQRALLDLSDPVRDRPRAAAVLRTLAACRAGEAPVAAWLQTVDRVFPGPAGAALLAQAQVLMPWQEGITAALLRGRLEAGDFDAAWQAGLAARRRFGPRPAVLAALWRAARGAGRDDEARRLRARLAREAPHLPITLHVAREEARARGDRGAVLDLLRRLHVVQPEDAEAALALAVECWEQDRPDEALAAARAGLVVAPADSDLFAAAAEWLRTLGRDEELRALHQQHALRHGEAALPARAEELLAHGEAAAAHALAAEAVAAAREPGWIHDLMPRILLALGRGEEARALLEDWRRRWPQPCFLAGRSFETLHELGRIDEARAGLERFLAGEPLYVYGWRCLAQWALDRGDAAALDRACAGWSRCEPRSPIPWGYRGARAVQAGDAAGARRHFEAALACDSGYLYGHQRVIDLAIEARDWPAAEAAAHRALARAPRDANVAAWHLKIAARRGDRAAVRARLFALAECRADEPGELAWVFEPLGAEPRLRGVVRTFFRRELAARLPSASLRAGAAAPLAIAPAVLHGLLLGLGLHVDRALATTLLSRLADHHPEEPRLIAALARDFVGVVAADLRAFVRRHREVLRATDLGWATAGLVLAGVRPGAALVWLRDWRARPRAPRWALRVLQDALCRVGRFNEAFHTVEHARRRGAPDTDLLAMELVAAPGLAAAGRWDELDALEARAGEEPDEDARREQAPGRAALAALCALRPADAAGATLGACPERSRRVPGSGGHPRRAERPPSVGRAFARCAALVRALPEQPLGALRATLWAALDVLRTRAGMSRAGRLGWSLEWVRRRNKTARRGPHGETDVGLPRDGPFPDEGRTRART